MLWYASVSTADGRIVDIDPSSLSVSYVNYLGNTVDIKGTVTKQVRNDSGTLVTATNANTDGKRDIVITSTAPNGNTAKGETIKITLSPNGIIKVESEALASRAIKDFQFKVYLKNATGVDPVTITIRHFPLDNIQSYTGEWSSRWDGQPVAPRMEYTNSLSVAQGWGSYETYSNPSVSYSAYIAYSGTKTDNGSTITLTDQQKNSIFGSTNNGTIYNSGATSLERAREYDGKYYWVTRSGGGWGGNYTYTYHVADTFTLTGTVYGHLVTIPSTGSWVEWGGKDGTTQEGIYTAKVYYNGMCYGISDHDSRGSSYTNLTNNHMYVLQITSTSDKYVLGKPVLDGNYQSQDRVVSPAFMIASQLGAVTPTESPTTASTHCGTYMEVEAGTGKRFVGWRLPTKQEVEVIIDYQNGTNTSNVTMVEVLGGKYYWALDGTAAYVSTGDQGSANNAYVRCVRDLTLEEVNALNRTTD